MSEQKAKKPNASQRLETVEVNVQELLAYLNNLSRDFQVMREAVKLLGNKLDAVQQATGVTDDQVAALMIQNNVKELQEKVQGYVDQGTLVKSEESNERSFLVGKEIDDDGKVLNERVQFAAGAMRDELRAKVMGKKVGDKVQFSEGTLSLEITEIYEIKPPSAPEATTEEQAEEQAAAPSAEA